MTKPTNVLVDKVDASEDSFVNPFVIFLGRLFVNRFPPPPKKPPYHPQGGLMDSNSD